jgi:hypothetical protein
MKRLRARCGSGLLLWGGLFLLAALGSPATPRAAGEETPLPEMEGAAGPENIHVRWNKAVAYFEARDYVRARELLKGVVEELRQKGETEAANVASVLFDQSGEKVVLQMLEQPKLGHEPYMLWHLWRAWHRQIIRDPQEINRFVDQAILPSTPEDTRWQIQQKILTHIGQFAVPALARYLERTPPVQGDEAYAANATALLIQLGESASLPVIALLDHPDETVKERACFILAKIEPPEDRAVAPLKRLWDDPNQTDVLRHHARRALERITGLPI